MSTPDEPRYDDRLVIQYLLGAVPEAEANRLDELSIADDDFAARLASVENDLVDAYVRGELAGAESERFRSHYLSSPVRREKVRFAEALVTAADRVSGTAHSSKHAESIQWHRPVWLLAAAACLLLLAGGAVLYQNGQLRIEMGRIRQERDALQARARSLQQPVESPPATAATPSENYPARLPLQSAIALVLMPQTRSIDPPATVALTSNNDAVNLQLQLEDESFPAYRVSLKDSASNRIVWRSEPLPPRTRGATKVVPLSVPAAVLTPRIYSVELTGIPARGASVSLSGYVFRVVR